MPNILYPFGDQGSMGPLRVGSYDTVMRQRASTAGFDFPPIGVGNGTDEVGLSRVWILPYACVLALLHNAAQRDLPAQRDPVSELSDMLVYALWRNRPRNSPNRRWR